MPFDHGGHDAAHATGAFGYSISQLAGADAGPQAEDAGGDCLGSTPPTHANMCCRAVDGTADMGLVDETGTLSGTGSGGSMTTRA